MTTEEHNARFEEWIAHHGAILHHVTHGFAEGHDRRDLMQELLLAVWKAVPAFREGSKASTFVYRVAHNVALTWKRTQSNYRRRVETFALQPTLTTAATAPVEREAEALAWVYAEIRKMPPVDRSLILLHLDGVSYADMAQLHGLSEANVGVRLTRLKHRLTDALKGLTHELR